jgi:hypothetical protein
LRNPRGNSASFVCRNISASSEAQFVPIGIPLVCLKTVQKLVQTCNSNFRYIEDILSLTNSRFCHYLHLICPNNLVAKNILFTCTSNMIYQLVFVSVLKWPLRYSQNIVKMTLNTSYSSLIRFFGFQYLLLPGSSHIYILHGLTLFVTLVVVKGRIRHRLRTVHFFVTTKIEN